MRKLTFAVCGALVVAVFGLRGGSSAQTPAAGQPVLYENARLITGDVAR